MSNSLVRFVLVRPEEAGNVGATARILANFGYDDLVLVDPRAVRIQEGYKWARGAEGILEGAGIVDALEEAVADCTTAWAATRRRGKQRGAYLDPREAAERTAGLHAGEIAAFVFGPESRGLATREVGLCTGRVTIPTTAAHPSLNLAQAVAVCAYECHRAHHREAGAAPRARRATVAEREALYTHLERSLSELGFLLPDTRAARMGQLRSVLERSALTPDETRFLRGLARKISRAARRLPPDPAGPG
jgi:TrmH family RNA methyltransferase